MKKHLSLLVLLLICTLPMFAYDFTVDGICYNKLGGDSVEVTNEAEYAWDGAGIYTGSVVISPSVIFEEVPYRVTTINQYAFYNCTNLTSISIPSSITAEINYATFSSTHSQCTSLDTLIWNVKNYPFKYADLGDIPIRTLIVSDEVEDFPSYLCNDMTNLTTVVWNVKNQADYDQMYAPFGFEWDSPCATITSFTFGDAVEHIPAYLCQNMIYLSSITIPSNVRSIGEEAFFNCQSATELIIQDGVTTIGGWAFCGCSKLTSISIPKSVTSIALRAFMSCSNIETIEVASDNQVYHSTNNCLIETATETLVLGCKNSIIPTDGSVRNIGDGAFQNSCNDSVIVNDNINLIGEYAFYNHKNLTTLVLGSGVQTIKNSAFASASLTSVTSLAIIPPAIVSEAFSGISDTTILYVPAESLEAYKVAEGWSQFKIIEAIAEDNPITALTLKTDRVTINPGDKYYLNSIVEPADANLANLVWSSDNEEVATVEDGLVIAHAEGKATITLATPDNAISATCVITVAEAGENGENNVVIDPSSESVNFSWPAVEEAALYVFVIYADAEQTEKICTLTFDDQGYLVRIDFLRKPSATRAAQRGFNFVVTGLESNTTYTYTLDSYDSENEVIERKAGSFTTIANVATSVANCGVRNTEVRKVLENGTIYILRDGEKYTIDGRKVLRF